MSNWLYFPGLRPVEEWAGAVSPIVERLVVYGVVEEEPPVVAVPLPWEVRVVAPLGSDRARFLSLYREMTGREGAVIRGQLLAMASRPERDRDEASVGSLTGALHRQGGGVVTDREKSRAERIWQARLVLKLAEAVNVAELEISRSLAALTGKQAEMMKALQGEDDGDEPEILPLPHTPQPVMERSFRVRDQLAAWAVFYLLDSGPEPLLITLDPEAVALLVDKVDKLAPGRTIALPDLQLAGDAADPTKVEHALSDLVQGKMEGAVTLAAAFAAQTSLQAGSPSLTLRLQLLPGEAFRRAMVALSGLAGDNGGAATPYVVVGVATQN